MNPELAARSNAYSCELGHELIEPFSDAVVPTGTAVAAENSYQ